MEKDANANTRFIFTPGAQRSVLILGVVAYVYTSLLYIITAYVHHETWIKTLNHLLLLSGFGLLSYNAIRKLKKNWRNPEKIENPREFFNRQVMFAWFLIFIHFIYICYNIADLGHSYYLFFGLAAYGLLASGRFMGIYLLVAFYVFSVIQHYPTDILSAAGTVSKVLVGIYMGMYGFLLGYWLERGDVAWK
jgi:hypothetical protein